MNAKKCVPKVAKKEVVNSVWMLKNDNATVWHVAPKITKGLIY